MSTVRRLRKDESGMTLGLALIMILLIGVMGAGLLTFVSGDLNAVIEVNRAQRAFEMADAGVAAAKRQLTSHCGGDAGCGVYYDGGADDIQWSTFYVGDAGVGGMWLTDLDGSLTTSDRVNVAIEYRPDTADFKVISTGYYGDARRKIEAIFKGVITFGGGDQLGHPLYYTPSDIKIEATTTQPVWLREISMYSAGDIIIQGPYNPTNPSSVTADRQAFRDEIKDRNSGYLKSTGQSDALEDWCTTTACNTNAFKRIPGNWNTRERKENADVYDTNPGKHVAGRDLTAPGFAAEGKICGLPDSGGSPTSIGECPSDYPSIADGVYAYDCTTGSLTIDKINPLDNEPVCTDPPEPRFSGSLTFKEKECTPTDCDTTQAGYISYPFPIPVPIPAAIYEQADAGDDETDKLWECDPTDGLECSPPFEDLMGSKDELVFIDAWGDTVNFQASGTKHGILVVWCGRLEQESGMQGVILNLNGDGTDFGASNCEGDETKGTYRNMGNGTKFAGWLYAEGGTDTMAGIELRPGSEVEKFPGGKWNFEMDAFENAPPNAFSLRGWRELYE